MSRVHTVCTPPSVSNDTSNHRHKHDHQQHRQSYRVQTNITRSFQVEEGGWGVEGWLTLAMFGIVIYMRDVTVSFMQVKRE